MTDSRKTDREAEFKLYFDTQDFLKQTGCASFTQLALMNPELWARLRQIPSIRLRIAVSHGWPIREVVDMHQQEGIDAVLDAGCDDPHLLWFTLPAQCEALHQLGWLVRLLGSIDIKLPAKDAIDRHGVHPGLFEIFPEVREVLDTRPEAGWPIRGGPVGRLSKPAGSGIFFLYLDVAKKRPARIALCSQSLYHRRTFIRRHP